MEFFIIQLPTGRSYGAQWFISIIKLPTGRSYGAQWFISIIKLPTGRSYGAQWNYLLFNYQQDAPTELNGIFYYSATNRTLLWSSMELYNYLKIPTGCPPTGELNGIHIDSISY